MAQLFNNKHRIPSARLQNWNYSNEAMYFVTICTLERQNLLVEEPLRFHNGKYELNLIGNEIEKLWWELPKLFSNITLDEFIVMPNHIHFVIGMGNNVFYKNGIKPQSLSDIIAKFKSISWINVKNNVWKNSLREQSIEHNVENIMEPQGLLYVSKQIWQKSFYDHVIRDENDLARIRDYMVNNPVQWELDEMNPKNLSAKSSGGLVPPE